MKPPILVRLDDGQVRVYDTAEDVLRAIHPENIEGGLCIFYDSEGFRLLPTIERVIEARRILGIIPASTEAVALTLRDYTPPLDRSAELIKSLRDYIAWPGFRINRAWIDTAALDDLIAKARQILW